jgi:predicted DNA-binding transcriptional regulator AlpA
MGFSMTSASPSPTLTREDMAAYLHRSVASVDRDDAAGRLPKSSRIGQRKLWLRSEIEAWLLAGMPDRATWEAMQKQGVTSPRLPR